MTRHIACALLCIASGFQAGTALAADPTSPVDWIVDNGDLSGDRHSPLRQIDTSNVARLRKACEFDTPDTVSCQSGIVAVDGTLYFTDRIYALDATSGRMVWKFHTVPQSGPARATWEKASAGNPPTGGATWTSYALDEAKSARTGKLIAYVQPIKGDVHDWDVSAAPALITGKSGKSLVAAAAKDGYVYAMEGCTSVKLMPRERMKGAPGMAWTSMDHPQLAFGQPHPAGMDG